MKSESIWIEIREWEISLKGQSNDFAGVDPELIEIQRKRTTRVQYWHSSGISGRGKAMVRLAGNRQIKVDTYFAIHFVSDDELHEELECEPDNDIRPHFGIYTVELDDIAILCPKSDREWVLAALREHRNPVISAKLRRLSESSETRVISEYRLISDKRAVLREESRP